MGMFTIHGAIFLLFGASFLSGEGAPRSVGFQPSDALHAAGSIPPSRDAGLSDFDKRLAAVDAKMAAVVDLRAEFEQRKNTAMLKKPMVSRGTLLCKGETVMWKTLTPRRTDMLVADGTVTILYPTDKLAETYPVGSRFRDAAGGPLPRLSSLKENFDLAELDAKVMAEELGAARPADRIAVELTPKSDELKKHIASIRVLIDESVPCADRVVIRDPDGEETELRFTDVRINTGMKDGELKLTLPPGTKTSSPTGPAR